MTKRLSMAAKIAIAVALVLALLAAAFVLLRDEDHPVDPEGAYVVEYEPSARCTTKWATPLGFFWGGRDEGWELLGVVYEQNGDIYEHDDVGVDRGDTVVDVGAHLGAFTRLALNRGASRVVAFEPNPHSAACFRKTFAHEIRKGQVVLVEEGAWEKSGTLEFSGHGLTYQVAKSSKYDTSNAQVIPVTTIDEVAKTYELERVDYIKMDIEGSERFALEGAKQTLARFHPKMAICVYHREDDPEVIPKEVSSADPSYRFVLGKTRKQMFFY